MAETRISGASAGTDVHTDYSVDTEVTDGVADQKETTWNNENWPTQLGYFTNISELQAVINAKSRWTVGKGFKTNPETKVILDGITTWGKGGFNSFLENMLRTMYIAGDSYAEIIRNKEGDLINIKPLDPQSINIIVNRKGTIKRYDQISKVKIPDKPFKPDKIFHLCRNRVADNIHGTSMIDVLIPTILRINEAKDDWKRVLHRNIDPMMIYHLDTDDTVEINAFKAKAEAARGAGENMYIPKDAVVPEQVSLAPNAALNPLSWIEAETDKFYEAAGVPKIIVGGAGGLTEAAVKIAYLAFQQTIEEEQLFVEEQCGIQLGLEIELEFPASLENELLSDNAKDATNGASQPNETKA